MSVSSEDKQRLKELITKRISAKGQVTKFKNYLNSISKLEELSDIQLTELTLRLAKFEALSIRVDDLQSDIEILSPHNISAEVDERDILEKDIIINIATAKHLLEFFTKKSTSASHDQRLSSCHDTSCCLDHQEVGIRLPQIQISKFDGTYFKWLEFRDTFENLIHKNERISSISKFHYLLSYLEGDAARILSNLEVSATNYKDAWELLCTRYDNKRLLINHHLNSLFNIKPITRESEKSLRFIVDHVTKNLRALAGLGQPTDKWDVLIIFMLSSKLDAGTLIKWEEHRNNLEGDVPTLDMFYKFLIDRADVLESLNRNCNKHESTQPKVLPFVNRNNTLHNNNKNNVHSTKSFISTNTKNIKKREKPISYICVICNDNHKIYDCPVFKMKGIDERMMEVSKYKLCVNCLKQGHPASECRLGPCQKCNQRHNSLLHRSSSSENHCSVVHDENELIVNLSNQHHNEILLSTAVIEVSNPITHQKERVRALLDSGSQSSFITTSLKNKIALKTNAIDCLKIIGIGNNVANNVIEGCNVKIQSLNHNFNTILPCFVMNELTGYLPKAPVAVNHLKIPQGVKFADPTFNQPAPIDVLIGADIFWDILGDEQHSLGVNNPKLRNSLLGWLISGPVGRNDPQKVAHCNHASISSQENENIERMITKFWDLEDIPRDRLLDTNDRICENHFITHTKRDETGRFSVKLPLKETPNCLGDSFHLAKKRLLNLERKFKRNPVLKLDYTKFITEYSQLKHLSPSKPHNTGYSYYLCHHAVLKHDSESTKLRVVFDGSAPSSSGYSLNNILMVGPNVQDSLFSILIRARQYKYLLTGDVEKMYRQVLVHKEDRCLQRILWRESESNPIKAYDLNTLTYGTASASYLSTRCLWQLGEEQADELIKTIIQKDFYVDDLITGADSEVQLQYIQRVVTKALQAGCFNLRKFKTNVPSLFDSLEINDNDALTISESSSTLGLGWAPSTDTLNFPLKGYTDSKDDVVTKRIILSYSFRIFDPLGLLSPVVIRPKIMLQGLWKAKLDWDDPVPDSIRAEWINFSSNLNCITNLQIPRLVLGDSPTNIELHAFSDASQHAYGACIYMKSTNSNNYVTVRLLCAKSKVAPLKPTTIPRLELCAALLAARLCKSVTDSIRYSPSRIVHWCDSTVVLGWIRNDLSKLKIFVANRISEITELTNAASWRYVPTAFNPADLISRGVDARDLISSSLWWFGPNFISKSEVHWPTLKVNSTNDLPEIKSHTAILREPIIEIARFSSFKRLQRCLAYVFRFIFNTRYPKGKRTGILSVDELRVSFYNLCAIAQSELYPLEYEILKQGKTLSTKNRLLSLSPFLDDRGLIRVGGRLNSSNYPYDKKHPILLHANHELTKLYFKNEHNNNLHAGPQLLLAIVRETIWPINGRYLARRTVNNCVRCRRLRGKTLCPKMGDLPAQRLNADFPMLSVGLDFAGPFFIINRKGRGSRVIKCYLCIFVCLRYKCVHLEAVSDLTKDAFVMTLRRFVARRGKPAEILCDNGRNFVAAAKEIGIFIQQNNETISDFANQQGIKFMFIPAYAPHFGGIYEAGVKSAKHHIKRVMGNSHLTFEEITTLFAQVEAILNSRPLCPMSSSPDDLLFLSPGHFLIGRPLTALPSPALTDIKESQLPRYARLEKIRQHFWQRWQREYVTELQQRTKWRTNTTRLSIGDMVLLSEDNIPPLNWRLGRVVQLFPGPDGISRVADVRTTRGIVRRALTRLCPLPSTEELKG